MRHVVCGEERGGRVARIDHDERRMIELQMINYQRIYPASNRSEPNHHDPPLIATESSFSVSHAVVLVVM
jgi:hypothetical protein